MTARRGAIQTLVLDPGRALDEYRASGPRLADWETLMGIKLEHYNLMTKKLRETVAFYSKVLGLYEGFYPVELGPGAWLYDSTDTPVVHMQEITPDSFDARQKATSLRIDDGAAASLEFDRLYGAGTIDHIAFACQDYDDFCSRLRGLGVPFAETGIASAAVRQLFLRDPNGIVVELNFRS